MKVGYWVEQGTAGWSWVQSCSASPGDLLCIEPTKHASAQHCYSLDSLDQTIPKPCQSHHLSTSLLTLSPNPVKQFTFDG